MIRHIVCFRLAAEDLVQQQEHAVELKRRLESLDNVVPGTLSIEVHSDLGLIQGHWHAVLIADYTSNEALEAYQANPLHREVAQWVSSIIAERAVVDFELA